MKAVVSTPREAAELERRLEIAQTCVNAAAAALEEYGDERTAAGLAWSFLDLRQALEDKQTG